MNSIYSYTLNDLQNYFVSLNLKPYKAKQVYKWLYEKRTTKFENMSDLSKDLIAQMNSDFVIDEFKIINKQFGNYFIIIFG